MTSRKGRSSLGCGSLLLALIAMLVLSGVLRTFWTRVDRQRFPWAYAESGRPTLTGTWVGSLTTGRGERRMLLLVIRVRPLDFSGRGGRRRGGGGRIYRRATSD